LLLVQSCGHASGFPASERVRLREKVREMFYHAYAGYMAHAFPHDELRPLSRTYTNSLIELGNAVRPTREGYKGVALTLIDSLDTLAVLGNASEFAWAVRWVEAHVSFDQDVDGAPCFHAGPPVNKGWL
jgi:mannosidase alpha-like ER degradation enhancer 1